MLKNVAPLSGSFMLTAMLGFLISVIWVYPNSATWGVAFGLVFFIMFIASVISTTYGPSEIELKMDRTRRSKKK